MGNNDDILLCRSHDLLHKLRNAEGYFPLGLGVSKNPSVNGFRPILRARPHGAGVIFLRPLLGLSVGFTQIEFPKKRCVLRLDVQVRGQDFGCMLGSAQIRGLEYIGLVPDFTQQILTNLVRLGNTVFSQVPVTERTDHAIGMLL